MSNLVSTIADFAVSNNENYIKMRERVMRRAAEMNEDVAPTIGSDGRLHSPHDGYYWDDNVYHGGSYLPFTADMWEMLVESSAGLVKLYDKSKHDQKLRIKSDLKTYNELVSALADLEEKGIKLKANLSHGAVWGDEDTCYIYLVTRHMALVNALRTHLDELRAEEELKREKRLAELKALKGTAPKGRVSVVGKIVNLKEDMTYFSYHGELSIKAFIELENKSTVYGTIPSSIYEAKKGDVIEFVASFEHANDDETHAFYKRPAKAKIIKSAETK